MRALIINGSPKGNDSITLQTCKYLELFYPTVVFEYENVGAKINAIIKNPLDILSKMEKCDLIIFSYPIYTFIAPYQLHKFIEIVKESGVNLVGKIATQITTSKHFYDYTAHEYIKENAIDMGMKFIDGLSADMDDLTTEKGQKEAIKFFSYVLFCIENDLFAQRKITYQEPKRVPVISNTVSRIKESGDVVIVTNCKKDDSQLSDMIDLFNNACARRVRIINLRDYPFKGGCLGCFRCAKSGKCIYKDGFDEFLRKEIQSAEAIVYAFSIKDHSMGADFKLYDDRQFCNGHRTVTTGMPVGYLISGNLSQEHNLQTIITARANVGGNFLAGIATDEVNPTQEIINLAKTLEFALSNEYVPPKNFLGVGGMKIFRDLIWQMQGFMKADHKFYKKHNHYDFPQKNRGKMLASYLIGALVSNEKLMSKAGNMMNKGMLMPYEKVLLKAKNSLNKNI